MARFPTLTKPRDLDHLTRQLQSILSQQAQETQAQLAKLVRQQGEMRPATPISSGDAVRLQDLEALRAELTQRIDAQDSLSTTANAISALNNVVAPLYFTEAPLGVIPSGGLVEFTPEQAIVTLGGRPVGVLNYKGRIYPYTLSASPEVGYWSYDTATGKVKINAADALEAGDIFEFALAILA